MSNGHPIHVETPPFHGGIHEDAQALIQGYNSGGYGNSSYGGGGYVAWFSRNPAAGRGKSGWWFKTFFPSIKGWLVG